MMRISTPRLLVVFALLVAPVSAARAQVTVWSDNFNNGCAANCLAPSWNGWTVQDNVGGVSGSDPNIWYVSCAEEGIVPPGCASTCVGDPSLHIGTSASAGGDLGAHFNEVDPTKATFRRAVSPTISTVGYANLTLSFDFIAFGSAACSDDRAQINLSTDNGATWPVGFQYCLSSVCCGSCDGYSPGQWTLYSLALPTAFNNNPNMRIGFHWRNNGNGSGTDPSVAIDDIRLTFVPQANLVITKSDGVTTAVPGGTLTYAIVASNYGPNDAPGTNVSDLFPASLTCSWTCAGSGGGSCTASGPGNINDTVNLPAGASVTYTASCSISASASGTLANTATVTPGAGIRDPVVGDNSATDTDTILTPVGEVPDRLSRGTPLSIAKNGAAPSHVDFAWGDSCGAGQTDFALYEGAIGSWYGHASKLCSTAGVFAANDVTPADGDRYYLVVPRSSGVEGSYGKDSAGSEIPRGSGVCAASWDTTSCPPPIAPRASRRRSKGAPGKK